jgi:3-oxoacyl-[acyl-carrier-protein] synthase-3
VVTVLFSYIFEEKSSGMRLHLFLQGGESVMRIAGTGSYLPEKVVNNEELRRTLGLDKGWIERRTGILERRYVENEDILYIAVEAARRAMEDYDGKPELILVHTSSPESSFPSIASKLAEKLGLTPVLAYDIVSGCTGFNQTLISAIAIMEKFNLKSSMLVSAEILSKKLDYSDKGTSILFGDGAGALILESKGRYGNFIISKDFGTDVRLCESLKLGIDLNSKIEMNGNEIFRFAVRNSIESIKNIVEKIGMSIQDIDKFIPHQSNARILKAVIRELNIPEEKIVSNISLIGNTGSSSIPIAMDEARRNGKLENNQKVLLTSYGAGLSWNSLLLNWRMDEEEKSCVLETVFQNY